MNGQINGAQLSDLFKAAALKGKEKEEGKSILCPSCGRILIKQMVAGYGEMYVHESSDRKRCKAQFKNLSEIENAEDRTPEEKADLPEHEEPAEEEEIRSGECGRQEPEIAGIISMEEYMDMEHRYIQEEIVKREEDYEKVQPPLNGMDSGLYVTDSEKEKVTSKMKKIDKSRVPVKELNPDEKSDEAEDEKRVIIRKTVIYKSDGLQENDYVNQSASAGEPPGGFEREELSKYCDERTQLLVSPEVNAGCPSLINAATGEIVEIIKPVFKIGKRPEFDLRINDNPAVSRFHAEILVKNEKCYIRDAGSTNGTYVNGMKLPSDTEMEIKDGQKVKFADEEFVFHIQ